MVSWAGALKYWILKLCCLVFDTNLTFKCLVRDEEIGLTEYSDAKISTAADIVCTVVAPLLVTVPMFVLSAVNDVRVRLGIIMSFTTAFSIWQVLPLSYSL